MKLFNRPIIAFLPLTLRDPGVAAPERPLYNFTTEKPTMNIKELDKEHKAQEMQGKVAARMAMDINRPYESLFIYGSINNNLRYINSSNRNSDFILFFIPTDWKKGLHTLTTESKVIRFEPSLGHPTQPEVWTAVRGEVFITDDSDSNFSGAFYCYKNLDRDNPALLGGKLQF